MKITQNVKKGHQNFIDIKTSFFHKITKEVNQLIRLKIHQGIIQ